MYRHWISIKTIIISVHKILKISGRMSGSPFFIASSKLSTANIILSYSIRYLCFSFIFFCNNPSSWSRALTIHYFFFFIKLRLISISLNNWKSLHHCTTVDPEHYYLLEYYYEILYNKSSTLYKIHSTNLTQLT
jgi:hypothetical protein